MKELLKRRISLATLVGCVSTLSFAEPLVVTADGLTLSSSATYETASINGDLTITGNGVVVANSGAITLGGTASSPVMAKVENGAVWQPSAALTAVSFIGKGGTIDLSSTAPYSGGWQTTGTFGRYSVCGLAADATSETGLMDIFRLGRNAALSASSVYNRNSSVVARILFDGGLIHCANKAVDQSKFWAGEGSELRLEGVNGNPVKFTALANAGTLFGGLGSGLVVVTGACDAVIEPVNDWNPIPEAYWGKAVVWRQTGNLTLGLRGVLNMTDSNMLPFGSGTGRVFLEGFNSSQPFWLNLQGTTQKINALIADGRSILTNRSTSLASLVFGTENVDGRFEVKRVGGRISVEKVGTGTLTIAQTPAFENLCVNAGTVRFDTTSLVLKDLTAKAGATIVVDGVTVAVETIQLEDGVTMTMLNGGKVVLASDVAAGEKMVLGDSEILDGVTLNKTGNGTLCYFGRAVPELVHVQSGVFSLTGMGTTNEFWRVTIKETEVAGNQLNLGPFRLFSEANNTSFCDGGVTSGTSQNFVRVDNATPPEMLEPKRVMFSSLDYEDETLYPKHGDDTQYTPEHAMFINSTVFSCRFNFIPRADTPSTWLVVTYRIPALAGKLVYGYNVKTQWNAWPRAFPGKWKVECSPSGREGTWEVADEQVTSQVGPNGASWYRSKPYPLKIADASCEGFVSAAHVQVDAGATFDATRVVGRQPVSSLTVDVAAGGGTLKGVMFAPGGTLNLTGVPVGESFKGRVPLALVDCADGNLDWKVFVNGVLTKRNVVCRNNQLEVLPTGFMIFVR